MCEETFMYVTLYLANQERRGKLGLEILNAKISTYFMHEEIFFGLESQVWNSLS